MWSRRELFGKWSRAALMMGVLLVAACSDDDGIAVEEPSGTGTFVDVRDGKEYHFVRLAGLEWSVENLAYDLGNTDLSRVYQSVDDFQKGQYATTLADKYGMLYSNSGALQAVPAGWRLPTDEDWAALEASHGYLSSSFGLLYGGYYTKNTYATADNGNRFMGSWAYFWTATSDDDKEGQFCFARKKFYGVQEMERLSMEPEAYFLSVRVVRDPLYYQE